MTVEQLQKIHLIDVTTPDQWEAICWRVCYMFNMHYEEVNKMNRWRYLWLLRKVEKALHRKPTKWFSADIETDATKITLGQYIDCQHWLRDKTPALEVCDMLAATLLRKRAKHNIDVEKVRKMRHERVVPKVMQFVESFNALVLRYAGLFDIELDEDGNVVEGEKVEVAPFLKRYGWIFSATQIAQLKGITLDKAFEVNVVEAFNYLGYLKAKQKYDEDQAKKASNGK